MARTELLSLDCDRCGEKISGPKDGRDEINHWREVSVRQVTDSLWRTGDDHDFILCPVCCSDVVKFVRTLPGGVGPDGRPHLGSATGADKEGE